MEKELISEIYRIKEIMGISLINEQFIDEALRTIFKSVDELNFSRLISDLESSGELEVKLLNTFRESLQKTSDESAKSVDNAIKNISKKTGKQYDDILKSILKNDEKTLEELSEELLKIESKNTKTIPTNISELIKRNSKDPNTKKILQNLEEIKSIILDGKTKGLTDEEINSAIDKAIESVKNGNYNQIVKDFWIKELNILKVTDNIEVKSNIFDKLKNDSKLSANKEIIGQKFKEAFYSIIESKGELWWNKNKSEIVVSITDTDGSVKNLNREEAYKIILDQVNNKTKGGKLYATNPSGKSKITPDEFFKNLENYKT